MDFIYVDSKKKGWDIRTYCDPQGKANYGRKLQPGSSNPNLSRACLFIMGHVPRVLTKPSECDVPQTTA